MSTFLQGCRYAGRRLWESPGFTLVAILTLALGIGANAAIFSFVDGVLLKPLPYAHPERIVMVWEKPPGGGRNGISTLNYLDWKNQNTVFDRMAAQRGESMTLSGVDEPIQLRAARVSAPYFEIFGVQPALACSLSARASRNSTRIRIRGGTSPSTVSRTASSDINYANRCMYSWPQWPQCC